MWWNSMTDLQKKDFRNLKEDEWLLSSYKIWWDEWDLSQIKKELFLLIYRTHNYEYLDTQNYINHKIADLFLDKYYKDLLEKKKNTDLELENSDNFWKGLDEHIEKIKEYLGERIDIQIIFKEVESWLKLKGYENEKYFDLERYKKENWYN